MISLYITYIISVFGLFIVGFSVRRIEQESSHTGLFKRSDVPGWLQTLVFYQAHLQKQPRLILAVVIQLLGYLIFMVSSVFFIIAIVTKNHDAMFMSVTISFCSLVWTTLIHLFEMGHAFVLEIIRDIRNGREKE